MQARAVVVSRVEHAVDAVAVQLPCIVVLHGLKVDLRLGCYSLVGAAAAEPIAHHGAGDVGAMPIGEIGSRRVTGGDRGQAGDPSGEVAVVVVKPGIAHGDLLATAVQSSDERGLNRVDSHVHPSLIVVQNQYRHRSDVGDRRVPD